MHINRIYDDLAKHIKPGKVLVIYGPRQVGKTTLLKHYLDQTQARYRFETGDNIRVQRLFREPDITQLTDYIQGYDLLVIDEAQRIPEIGLSLKLLVDQFPTLSIVVTGSSSFELAGQIGEPLTGRKKTLTLYPLSQFEQAQTMNRYDLTQLTESFLRYGCYPEIVAATTENEKRELLIELTESYLLKDILALDKIKNSKALLDLLRLLAFQIGSEVSHTELGQKIGLDNKTVARYLDLLEKTFVIYNLRGFSRNLRKEITKKSKYYFFDVGIRNAIILNFNSLELRNDVGELWENYLIMERLKTQAYRPLPANNYFWRTWDQQEIDFIEERDGKLHGFEIKWQSTKVKIPKDWLGTYSNATFKLINKENYLDFLLEE